MNQLLTKRQIQRLGKLPPDYRIVSAQKRFSMVRRPVQRNSRLAVSPLAERVQAYLRVDGG